MKRILAFIMTLFFLLPSQISATAVSSADSVTITLEDAAINYVQSYIAATYNYDIVDLSAGTIKEVSSISGIVTAEALPANMQSEVIPVWNYTRSIAEACESISSFEAAANYYRHIRSAQNVTYHDFDCSISVVETRSTAQTAYVHLYSDISFKYTPTSEVSLCGDNFIVYFSKLNNDWVISDIVAEELIAYGLTNMAVNYEARIENFDAWFEDCGSSVGLISDEVDAALSSNTSTSGSSRSSSIYDYTYNKTNAIAYAYTYTTSSHNAQSGNNSSFLNDNFHYYPTEGNCQNFVSQCVWAGFNGINEENAIIDDLFPMNDGWHAISHTSSWTEVNSFYSYFSSSNSEFITTTGNVNGSFSGIPTASLPGSVLHINPNDSGGYGHAVLITAANGYNYNEIEICGNSPMRKGVVLSTQISSNQMRIIIPNSAKSGRSCTNGSHSFDGSGCKCIYCGYNKLRITGSMLKPIPVGSTKTITALANSSCYRIAIAIKHIDDSSSVWTEYVGVSQISKSWTFSKTGLYIIEVVARDINPADADSVTAKHIFTIRVY